MVLRENQKRKGWCFRESNFFLSINLKILIHECFGSASALMMEAIKA